MNSGKQIKMGAIISYVLIAANAFWGLIITPFVLRTLGTASYGVYQTISSFAASMMVLDFGLGAMVMRYVAKYRAERKNNEIEPFISMAICEAVILIVVVAVVSLVLYFNIDGIYGESFSKEQLTSAHQIFIVLSVLMMAQFIEHIFNGVISGYNNFILSNGIKLIRLVFKMVLVFVLLPIYKNAVVLVAIDLGITILMILAEMFYIRNRYKLKIRFSYKTWDGAVFKESFIYALMLFLMSITAQIEGNLDTIVIGAVRGPELVTIYSFGITIFSMYKQISTSISGVMLPTVTEQIQHDETGTKIQNLIVSVGRVQFILLGAATVGFVVLGKEFIALWLGNGFEDVYIITLILMLPALFELCVNVCLAVLRAKNMLGFQTSVLFLSTILNLVITVVGVTLWNYFAAAIGTAFSFIVGSLIIMNIYYHKKLGFNMFAIYRRILSKIWSCLLIAGASIWIISKYIAGSWIAFAANILIFCVIYGLCLVLWGLNADEKRQISLINKLNFRRSKSE